MTSETTKTFSLADCDMRPATVDDIPVIVATLEEARSLLAADGIDQWQNGTGPNFKNVALDLEFGWGRVFTVKGSVAATAALVDVNDPNYNELLEGAWEEPETPGPYATIHRVAVSPAYRGQHVAQLFYRRLIEEARVRGFAELRVDTHPQNVRMQHVIENSGFKRVGTCCINGNKEDLRWSYQLFL